MQDPYNYDKYLRNNHFLADINNERPAKQQIYKDNMLSLKQLVLVRFSDDLLVVPRDSAWFSYWNGHQLQSMNETQLYQACVSAYKSLNAVAIKQPFFVCPHCCLTTADKQGKPAVS